MKNAKLFFKRLFDSNRFLQIFSLVIAFLVWLVVVFFVDKTQPRTIRDVPITFEQTAALSKLELNVISVEPQTVDVNLTGTRYIVRELGPEDLRIVPNLSAIINTGTQNVPLEWVDESGGEYVVDSIEPASVSVRVDRMKTVTLDVRPNVSGLDLPEGYIKEAEFTTPETVSITGPARDVDKVAHAIVNIDVGKSVTSTISMTGDIELRDANGNAVESDHIQLDSDTAEVTIPVLKKKEVHTAISFLNVPPYFPLDELQYTFSNSTIEIAGPQTLVDSYDEVMLGYVDFKRLDVGTREVFDVTLPSGFLNVGNIQSVSVSFDTEDFDTRAFDISDIQVVNVPAGYSAVLASGSERIRGVQIIGPRDTLEAMTSEDIVARVDLSGREREMDATGAIRLPVTIFVPTKGTVWAYGDYSAIVDIAEET